jgi:hypothetical protein
VPDAPGCLVLHRDSRGRQVPCPGYPHVRFSIDPAGTCHQVGCPTKGTVDEHVKPTAIVIGAGEWRDYTEPEHCLGFPVAMAAGATWIYLRCSISATSWAVKVSNLSPSAMAALVNDHKRDCPNRKAR